MEELKIEIKNREFICKKTLNGNYEVNPYDETIKDKDIMNAILKHTDYYVTEIGTILPRKNDGQPLPQHIQPYYLVHLELKNNKG